MRTAPATFRPICSSGPRRDRGFSLLEVLIALLVLSIGLLGLAGLQVFSLKYNHQSYERTQATLMTYDIADRMRANPEGVFGGNYDSIGKTDAAPSYVDCASAACSAGADIANFDIAMWKLGLAQPGNLAGGAGAIQRLATPNGALFRITVWWREDDLDLSQSLDVQVI